ncbi:hypothetical protein [Pseudoxanthomonas sp. CCNWLY206-1]|uniref:hypothetical protein n=1 Tax=Pseudoxanthomonas sp. CCNWLY206-1 TaxID=3138501 RepID=UPI00321654D2
MEPAYALELSRLRKIISYIGSIVDNADPEIAGTQPLDNMQTFVGLMLSELSTMPEAGNLGHLQTANSQADQMLSFAMQVPFNAVGSARTTLTKAATAYSEAMGEYATRYDQHMRELAASAENDLDVLKTKLEAAEKTIFKLEARIGTNEAATQTQLAEFNSSFQVSEAARGERFETYVVKFQDKTDAHFQEMIMKSAKGLEALSKYQEDAHQVLGTVVNTAQAGSYASYASEEKKNANLYRYGAITAMVLAALIMFMPELIGYYQLGSAHTIDWKQALYRLAFSAALFAPAYYLAKESSTHRTNEVSNRRRQHILMTIEPYLALLDKAKADEIKAEVAKNIFSDNSPTAEVKNGDASNLIAQMTNFLNSLAKHRK